MDGWVWVRDRMKMSLTQSASGQYRTPSRVMPRSGIISLASNLHPATARPTREQQEGSVARGQLRGRLAGNFRF